MRDETHGRPLDLDRAHAERRLAFLKMVEDNQVST